MDSLKGRRVLTARRPAVEVIIKHELDAATAPRLARMLDNLLALHPDRLIIDLANCPFLDATIVEVLLDAHRRAWRDGGQLCLRAPSPRVRRLLELARVDRVLDITPDPGEQQGSRHPSGKTATDHA